MSISDDLVEQTDQCLKNIEAALKQAGASLKDVVRVTYVLPNAADFQKCWPVLRRYFGKIRPAATRSPPDSPIRACKSKSKSPREFAHSLDGRAISRPRQRRGDPRPQEIPHHRLKPLGLIVLKTVPRVGDHFDPKARVEPLQLTRRLERNHSSIRNDQ